MVVLPFKKFSRKKTLKKCDIFKKKVLISISATLMPGTQLVASLK